MKSENEYFIDWVSETFGYGYGSGEIHMLKALKDLFSVMKDDKYDYEKLEKVLGAQVTWLLLQILHSSPGFFGYGTSTRFAWLDAGGKAVQNFVRDKTVDELYDISVASVEEDYIHCGLDYCNCNPPTSFSKRCLNNPFFS